MITPRPTPAVTIAIAVMAFVIMSACVPESSHRTQNGAESTAHPTTPVSPEIAVLAHRLVFAYMSDKTWGFFGATCEKWIEMDYEWDKSSSKIIEDGRIKVAYARQPDRMLGPDELIFYVDVDSGDVQGDNESETGRSGVAEGCDRW